jgi:hypothetical protein
MMWQARLQALKSFDGFMDGDVFDVELTEYWAHLVANDYVKLVEKWRLDIQSDSITFRFVSNPSKLDDA